MASDIKKNILLGGVKLLGFLPVKLQKNIADRILNNMFRNDIRILIKNEEVLNQAEGPCIFIANHLSNIDGIVLTRILRKFDPYFVAGIKLSKDTFTNFFKNVVKTINITPNTADLDSMREIITKVKEGNSVMIFPEGTRSRNGAMNEAKKGILLIAKMTKAKVVPISLMGTEKVLPISQDGDMSHERPQKGTVRVVVGEPFTVKNKEKSEDKTEYETRTMNEIMGAIAMNLDPEYRGYYKYLVNEESK